jgi:hypothetical protein
MAEGTALAVHEEGLLRVLSEWSGAGNLYRAVAAVTPDAFDRHWTPKDIERRAMRILLLECSPLLRRWPQSAKAWQEHLPVLSMRHRFWSDVPQTRVDWAKTRHRGWPPYSFAIRRRHRSTDQVTLSVLAWTLARLKEAFDASQSLVGPHAAAAQGLATDVEQILVRTLPILDLLDESDESLPSRDDVRAVRTAGWPWNVVAEVADVFTALERGGAEALARRLLRPDGFPEAVFQLGVLGAVLVASEGLGARIASLRPIGYMTDGPVYRIELPGQDAWDLWCEAANCWTEYDLDDRYRELSATMTSADGKAFGARNIRPDVLLARRSDQAMVLECKYPGESLDAGYVAHGMYQAAFYAHQLKPAFVTVTGLSVGPSELVPVHSSRTLGQVEVGLASPTRVQELVTKWLGTGRETEGGDLGPS